MTFYTKRLSEDTDEGVGDEDRLQPSWGNRVQPADDFRVGRNGDHLLVPFECDLCIYKKLRKCYPHEDNPRNQVLEACIRQANLDAFWSRASSTVRANRDKTQLALKLSSSVGLDGPYFHTCYLPPYDHCGYEVAVQMLLASKRPGRHSNEYSQYDTIRKVRTSYSNFARSSAQENSTVTGFGNDKGQAQRLVADPVSSYWFSRFFAGCKRRMGQDWRPNVALSTDLILAILEKVQEINTTGQTTTNPEEHHQWLVFGVYVAITYTLSLRGTEGLLLDVGGVRKYRNDGQNEHFIIALRGKIKGEHADRCHLFPCCIMTSSGIPVRDWVTRLIDLKESLGQVSGPAISNIHGQILTTAKLDLLLVTILEELHDTNIELFPSSLRQNKEDLGTPYQVFRSLRRASDTRALEKNISKTDIEVVNRWHSVEQAKGNRPSRPMHQHYAQAELLVAPFVRYTTAM
jgi:hypothetical protein